MAGNVSIENPILNGPFSEPTRHFRFGSDGITDEVIDGRRPSEYFVPIPKSRRKGGQLVIDEWVGDRLQNSEFINQVRSRVQRWRNAGWPSITPTTRYLLEYWTDPDRENKLFFCQVEALETAIYIAEAAKKSGDNWIENQLREYAEASNPGLFRIAHKMATGSGKTVVMSMLIAWQTLNKVANPQDARFGDAFLLVAPGITIRDRLRVLLPSSSDNYYRERDVVPPDRMGELGRAKVVIVNFHQLQLREKVKASKLTKAIAGQQPGTFTETPADMAARVCREFGNKRNIVVINDEAHHCYHRRALLEDEDMVSEDKRATEERNEEARVWASGLQAISAKRGIRTVYDLSATPFFLQGSGWPEGTLFQWVVSDFSLVDAIEAGLVKIPRVPVDDNTQQADGMPMNRNLWAVIKDGLPKRGRRTEGSGGEPQLPGNLQAAISSLYSNYECSFRDWQEAGAGTPPVFIVVCNNTTVSKQVYDYIAGWEKPLPDGPSVVVPGHIPLFSNEEGGRWSHRPRSVLVDSSQLESGNAMSAEFKAAAGVEIAKFKDEIAERFPGRSTEDITDEDLLREVMNTVGKPGKLGEDIRCVVSVSMLTEGWDANTVTHILGVRAFGTQLLCEQVVGRGLRRRSYVLGDDGRFAPEYAEVYGVPFSFIPASGGTSDPKPPQIPTRVHSVVARSELEITFPHIVGYRYDMPDENIAFSFSDEHQMSLTSRQIPTRTAVAGMVGGEQEHRLEYFEAMRAQHVAFLLAKELLDRHFRKDSPDGQPPGERPWLFPTLVTEIRKWMDEYVTVAGGACIGLLALQQNADDAVEKLASAYRTFIGGDAKLRAVVRSFDPVGNTSYVDFDTTKDCYPTREDKCPVSHVVQDSGWEAAFAEQLEHMNGMHSYVKNHKLGFSIPYVLDGVQRSYVPDFIVKVDDGREDLLNLVVEVSGEAKRDKARKVQTARELWTPAVNNHGGFGRWRFVEITDPWGETQAVIREAAGGGMPIPSGPLLKNP